MARAVFNRRESIAPLPPSLSNYPSSPFARAAWPAIIEMEARIAVEFYAGTAAGSIAAAADAREKAGIKQAAMSGGCLRNRRLGSLLRAGSKEEDFQALKYVQASPSDDGLSYGQGVVGAEVLNDRRAES